MTSIFGYMRVSKKDEQRQNSDRQKLALQQYAKANNFIFNDIVFDRMSGTTKAETRPQYNILKTKQLRNGDILVITDLDRLGRDADDTIREMKELKEKGIKVVALDIPKLNEWDRVTNDSMYDMIIDILITLKAHMAQQEREKIVYRINQGLAVAKEKGKKLGRPKVKLPDNFLKEYRKFKEGKYGDMSSTAFAKMLGMGRATLYKYIKIYEEQKQGS